MLGVNASNGTQHDGQLRDALAQIKTLSVELSSKESTIGDLKLTLEAVRKEKQVVLSELLSERESGKKRLDSLDTVSSETTAQLSAKLKQSQILLSTAEDEVESSKTIIANLKKKIQSLGTELSQARDLASEKEASLSAELSSSHRERATALNEMEKLRIEVTDLNARIASLSANKQNSDLMYSSADQISR